MVDALGRVTSVSRRYARPGGDWRQLVEEQWASDGPEMSQSSEVIVPNSRYVMTVGATSAEGRIVGPITWTRSDREMVPGGQTYNSSGTGGVMDIRIPECMEVNVTWTARDDQGKVGSTNFHMFNRRNCAGAL